MPDKPSQQRFGKSRPAAVSPAGRRQLAEATRLLRAGKPDAAATLCDAVLVLEPAHADALHLGGLIALERGRPDLAVDRLRRAALQRPRDAALIGDLGVALGRAGKPKDAELALRAALTLSPDLLAAQRQLAELLEMLARDDEAAALYEAILLRQPRQAELHNRLARLRLRLKLPHEALASARQAVALKPRWCPAIQTLGTALDMLGRYDEAVAARREAIRLEPTAAAWYDLGMTEMNYGQLDAAATSFRQAIALEPGRGNWHRALSLLVDHHDRDGDIAAMLALYQAPGLAPDDRMHLGFGLGKALDDIGAYDEAFDYFLEGNRLKRARLHYSNAETDRLYDTITAAFTPARIAAHAGTGAPDETPIFVLGMPRSCTSLVEQILTSHPDVTGGGEFRLVNQLVGGFVDGPGFPLAEALDAAGPSALRELGERYVGQVRALAPGARFVTDKLPGNFLMIGMIKLMLPNARIIHCRRDPLDNCLSIFKNYFAGDGLRYGYDLAEIGHYHRRYRELMAHWHAVLPGAVYDVDYETLVADFEGEARRLVAHCGLDWRDEIRQYYRTSRPVDTASAAQVRQPIFTSSIGKAARYGDRLRPLLDALAL